MDGGVAFRLRNVAQGNVRWSIGHFLNGKVSAC
jgi:hypothetical protein